MADLGERDAAYIRKVIRVQRGLEGGGRAALLVSLFPPAWLAGTTRAVGGQDPREHGARPQRHARPVGLDARPGDPLDARGSGTTSRAAEGWKNSHNYEHHTYTNVVGKDRDLGYTLLRARPRPAVEAVPPRPAAVYNVLLALAFEWGVALLRPRARRGSQGPQVVASRRAPTSAGWPARPRKQVAKDYVVWPLLSGPSAVPAFLGNLTANLVRNVWSHTIIFCGHFPDGAETFDFDEADLDGETRGGWYVRQLLGSCNIDGGRAHAPHDRQPELPDRAPPLPRPAVATATPKSPRGCANCASATGCRT